MIGFHKKGTLKSGPRHLGSAGWNCDESKKKMQRGLLFPKSDGPLGEWTSMRGRVTQKNEKKQPHYCKVHPSSKATLSTSNESLLAFFGSSLVLLAHSKPHTLVRSIRRVRGGYSSYLQAGCVSHWHWSLVKGNAYLMFRWKLKVDHFKWNLDKTIMCMCKKII